MTSIRSKIFEVFRNLTSDAMPRPPRNDPPQQQREEVFDSYFPQNNDENQDSSNDAEEIIIEPNDEYEPNIKGKKSKPQKPKDKADKKTGSGFFKKSKKEDRRDSNSTVNTQAAGAVINVVNSDNFHWGDDITYYVNSKPNKKKSTKYQDDDDFDDEDETIEKCNLITLLIEAEIEPSQKYLGYISKNLGKKWEKFFRYIGFSQGVIESMDIDATRKGGGVSETRYQLLLDWVRNEDDNSLGRLSTLLWEHGERQIVKELALIYNHSK